MYQALYRKYRPAVFDDVCGQEHITSVLQYACAHGRVSHAYLFCGSRGTGKTTCAKILAKAVNCENPRNGNPCGECAACRSIDAGSAMDVLEMDAASNNGVEYIRDIRDAVAFTPASLKRRVYIIDEVHMLTTSAFNALLKTLEEPPEHVLFILATTEMHKLPATIISRCQRFDFRRIPLSVLTARLAYIAERESIELEEEAAQRIARQAQGGMRDAISLFELCSGGGAAVTVPRVEEILGLSSLDFLHDAAAALAAGDAKAILERIAETAASSKDISVFWQELTSYYRDMLISKYAGDPAQYLDLTPSETAQLSDAAGRFSLSQLTYHASILDRAMSEMQRMPAMKRTIAELAAIRMCDARLDDSTEALAARVEQLENRLALLAVGGTADVQPAASEPKPERPAEMPPQETPRAVKPAPPAVPVTPAASAPQEKTEELLPLQDMSEFLEKLAELDRQTGSFLDEAGVWLSPDGKRAVIRCRSAFAEKMLSREGAKNAIAQALAICRVTDGRAAVSIEIEAPRAEGTPAAEELFT